MTTTRPDPTNIISPRINFFRHRCRPLLSSKNQQQWRLQVLINQLQDS